jgi:methylated-DNA-[protein]-cysteine S-methyltransferase
MPSQSTLLQTVTGQLDAYFVGSLTVFDLPLHPSGTDFQQAVWAVMRDESRAGADSLPQDF